MPHLNKALSVGTLVAVTGIAFLLIFTFIKKGGYSEKDSYVVHALFSDATGLTWKSRVQIAGIQVGEVDKISLVGQRARLEMRIKKGVELKADACLSKVFPSALLPDALLEVSLGSEASPALSSLPEAQREVTCVRESGGTQKLIETLSKIAADVQVVSADLSRMVGSERGSMREIIENIVRLTQRLDDTVAQNQGKLTSLISNAEAISGDLRDLTGSEKEHIRQIVRNTEVVSRQLREVLASVQGIVDGTTPDSGPSPVGGVAQGVGARPPGGAAGVAGAPVAAGAAGAAVASGAQAGATTVIVTGPTSAEAKGVKQAIEKANDSLARVDKLLAKLQEGDSIAGKLINDERLGNKMADALETYSTYVDNLNRMQIEVKLRSEWLLNQTAAKTYFGIRLVPRPDKYYIFEMVSDPRGVDSVVTTTTSTQVGSAPATPATVVTTQTHEQKLTFTLEMAKRYGPVAFRVGVIESSGGVGSDLFLFNERLQVSVSVYQFSRPFTGVFPRAKVWVNYSFLQHFYATAGSDDFLNQWRQGKYPGGPKFALGSDVFFGGGLFFTDDDLKTLFGMGAASAIAPATK
jgi:phospholipid/cholesterol/gamma-HCH transport system substrate-binding protein